ncbi:MAG: hypothetical protein C0600_04575, partial [Ignavibacteria bacterium]
AVRVYPSRQKPFDIVPPTVDVINPIGSGDVMSGALAMALGEGEDLQAALRFAIAAATANAASLLPGTFEVEYMRQLSDGMAPLQDRG